MKKRILEFLIKIGKKCKPLTYPVMIVVIAFLTIYHAIRNLFIKKENKWKSLVTGAICLVAVVGAVLVLPSLADEMTGESQTETVSEEELEPTMTPDVTVEPVVTEEPEEKQDSEETESAEETTKPEEEKKDEEKATDEPQATEEPQYQSAAKQDESDNLPKEEKKAIKKKREAAPVQLEKPTCQVVEQPVGPYTYPMDSTIKVKVEVTPPAGAGYECQWYVSKTANGTGEALVGNGAKTTTYSIPKDTGAGDYYFYCMVKSVDNNQYDLDSEEVRSDDVVVTIQKGEPQLSDFDISTIKEEYYYTGEIINPTIVSSKEGMGSAYIVVKDGTTENRPKADSDDPYAIYLHVSKGSNYKAKTIDLNKTITIKRYPTPTKPYTVSGTKGKLVDGKQWYTSDVKIVPMSGYLISTDESDFKDSIICSSDGTNQGPLKVYLKNKNNKGITGAITVAEKRDGQINIDKTKPTATITYEGKQYSDADHELGVDCFNHDVVFSLSAEDETSKVDSRAYVLATKAMTASQLKSASWVTLAEGDTVTFSREGKRIFYARVIDKAGNTTYSASNQITVDKTLPEILCGSKKLGDTKSYIADRKKITVTDDYLSKVTVKNGSNTVLTKTEDDITKGSVSFVIERTTETNDDIVYEITAEDKSGNQKVTTLTLKNPVLDVDAKNLDFGSGNSALTYGYEEVEAQAVSLINKANNQPVAADSITLEGANGEAEYFEVAEGTKIRPKQGLHAGTYTEAVRIAYNGDAESEVTCKCSVTIKKANMLVRYTGQKDVGYHTLPDLKGTIEYTATDFKNGDTKDVFVKDADFVAPKLYYMDENQNSQEFTSDKRAMETMQLIPDGGSSHDYEFSYAAGELEVKHHVLRDGYVIEGKKVKGYDWYVSDYVAIRPAANYQISDSEAADSFASQTQSISVAGPTNGVEKSFYVMNTQTGEISAQMKETIKIDNTAPYFRNGEGITVSSNLWAEFCNSVSFGLFFNQTKAVSISATDEESGLEPIQYCISEKAVEGTAESLDTKLNWVTYEDGFSISPEEYESAVIYVKITNHAGLSTYISSNGLVFDNKQPEINKVENGKEQGIVDEKEYITEVLSLKVSDGNLNETTLYEGTDVTASGSALSIVEESEGLKTAEKKIACPQKGSKTYTVVARDSAGNNAEREFTITKPIYDITADTLKIADAVYGYTSTPQTKITFKNTDKANADATIQKVILGDDKHFEVKNTGNEFWIAAKEGLSHGKYATDVTLVYNGGKEAKTTCGFSVDKAVLKATYSGDDLYYHETLAKGSVKVTGFVTQNGVVETPETAAGYVAPTVDFTQTAKETKELTPKGGKADNYTFEYVSGLLLVDRRYASAGKDGQYRIEGSVSDTGWYTSDLRIVPKDGYELLREEEGKTLDEIALTKDTDCGEEKFYIMNETTGEIYYPSVFNYKKDTKMPEIKGVEKDATYEANSREVTVSDENLSNVTVNGKPQSMENNTVTFTLTAEQETMVYVITATDCAGNMSDCTVVLNQPASLPASDDTNADNAGNSGDNNTDGNAVTPTASPSQAIAGIVKKHVKVVDGAPNTALVTGTQDLKTSVLSNGEQQAVEDGSNANIELRIKNIDGSVPQNDKELVIANLSGYSVGEYLDITLWKKVGSSSEKKVTNLAKPISVTVTVPSDLRNASREFVVLRVHKGKVSVLEDLDSATNTVTFKTDRFSTYALAYRTAAALTTRQTNSTKNTSVIGTLATNPSPDTGDTAPLLPIAIVFLGSLSGILITMVLRRKM